MVSHTAEPAGKQKDLTTQLLLKYQHHKHIFGMWEEVVMADVVWAWDRERDWVLSLRNRSLAWSGLMQAHQPLAGLPHTSTPVHTVSVLLLLQPEKSSSIKVWRGQQHRARHNSAEDREKASKSKCLSLWARVGFTGAPLTFQSDLNLQENAWEQRITHTICKHIKILRTLAFVRNFVNSCQIKLISVRQYNNTPYK